MSEPLGGPLWSRAMFEGSSGSGIHRDPAAAAAAAAAATQEAGSPRAAMRKRAADPAWWIEQQELPRLINEQCQITASSPTKRQRTPGFDPPHSINLLGNPLVSPTGTPSLPASSAPSLHAPGAFPITSSLTPEDSRLAFTGPPEAASASAFPLSEVSCTGSDPQPSEPAVAAPSAPAAAISGFQQAISDQPDVQHRLPSPSPYQLALVPFTPLPAPSTIPPPLAPLPSPATASIPPPFPESSSPRFSTSQEWPPLVQGGALTEWGRMLLSGNSGGVGGIDGPLGQIGYPSSALLGVAKNRPIQIKGGKSLTEALDLVGASENPLPPAVSRHSSGSDVSKAEADAERELEGSQQEGAMEC